MKIKMNSKWVFGFILFLGITAQAFGTVTIEGTGYGKTEKVFMLESKGQIFSLKKESLSPEQRSFLENLKWGAPASLTISFNAIASVKDAPKKSR